jgi:glutamate synthase domain-containing protein 3
VVEGVGDHGCEYMTGGRVVVLGPTGRNFAAGMSGGIAYVYDEAGDFGLRRLNGANVSLEEISASDAAELRALVAEHARRTGSAVAERLLGDWEASLERFVKVMPDDFRRVLDEQAALAGELAEVS